MPNPNPNRHAPHEVDAYLAAQAPEFRATLQRLRALVTAAAPACTERVSYGIAMFRLGKDFLALSAAKGHCALHTMSRAIPVDMKDELRAAGIRSSGTTLHISPADDVPAPLVEKVVRARLAEVQGS